MNFTRLTKEKLDVNSISELVADETCGAISLFVGTTRDNFEDKKVSSIFSNLKFIVISVRIFDCACDKECIFDGSAKYFPFFRYYP